MLEYPGYCYLDTEKTGSSFVRTFLLRHSPGAPIRNVKHMPPRKARRGRKLYFTSCRDPYDQYASLYAFGCAGRGALLKRLRARGSPIAAHYDATPGGFERWLAALLEDPRPALPDGLRGAGGVGLQGLRYLRLNMPAARLRLIGRPSPGRIARRYRRHGLPSVILRNETLNADLEELIAGPLGAYLADPEAAIAELRQGKVRANASQRAFTMPVEALSAELRQRLVAAEWFHFDVLGYPRYE